MSATTGKRALVAVLAIGLPQQAAYQRKTLPEKVRQRTMSTPVASVTRPAAM